MKNLKQHILKWFAFYGIKFYDNVLPVDHFTTIFWEPDCDSLFFVPKIDLLDDMIPSEAQYRFLEKYAELVNENSSSAILKMFVPRFDPSINYNPYPNIKIISRQLV